MTRRETMDIEEAAVTLIASAGDARSDAMEAIDEAKAGRFEEARSAIANGRSCLTKAHEMQLKLLSEEANGNKDLTTLLMMHAQDHFMNAVTVLDLAQESIDVIERLAKVEERTGLR